MKNKLNLIVRSLAFAVLAILLVGCSSKMTPLPASLFTVNPSPMEVQGNKIPVTINGKFPEKWFNKNAEVTITPVLVSGTRELWGKSATYQGENVAGNGITISQKNGGAFTLKSEFDYDPEFINPELYLRFSTKIKNKEVALPDVKIAQGLITTAGLADAYSTTPASAFDNFQKSIKDAYEADIHFLIQQAELRSSQLNSSNMEAWRKLVKDAGDDQKKKMSIEVLAYASPDGGFQLNEKLAEKRERNTSAYLEKELKKDQINTEIYANYTAQDWEGFKKLVQASSLQDKDLVLRVISMYNDPADREREIKNISIIYKDLAETILPQLRRSRLIANIETIGKSDSELKQAYQSNPTSLNIEELLYTATLPDTPTEQIYMFITQRFPNDYRAWNNLGAYYFQAGQKDKANQAFLQAQQINSRAAEPNMNLGLLAVGEGNMSKAEQLIGGASQANSIGEALGLLYLKKGDYAQAAQAFGNAQTNNAALAQLLTKNYSQAQQILDAVPNKDGITYYLMALVSARTHDANGISQNLSKALQLSPSLKRYAANDLEFARFANNSAVTDLFR